MKKCLCSLSVVLCLLCFTAEAYYIEERVTLSGGWNAVMLEATPKNQMSDDFFADWPVDRAYCILNVPKTVKA